MNKTAPKNDLDPVLRDIVDTLEELTRDETIPRNVKGRLQEILQSLKVNNDELSIRVNKALNDLDEISNDSNLQPFTRTQLWNIASMLESL